MDTSGDKIHELRSLDFLSQQLLVTASTVRRLILLFDAPHIDFTGDSANAWATDIDASMSMLGASIRRKRADRRRRLEA